MSIQKVKTAEVDGVRVDVMFNTETGSFTAKTDNNDFKSTTLKGLLSALRQAKRQERAEVPVTRLGRGWLSDDEVKHGLCVGIHMGNGNFLFRWDGEKGSSQDYGGSVVRRLTAEEVAEYKRLMKEKRQAEEAVEKFRKRVAINLKAELAKASGDGKD